MIYVTVSRVSSRIVRFSLLEILASAPYVPARSIWDETPGAQRNFDDLQRRLNRNLRAYILGQPQDRGRHR